MFWAVVWFIVLAFAVAGRFWVPAIYVVIGIAALFCGIFIAEYIRIKRLK